jgi:hypothetical protein
MKLFSENPRAPDWTPGLCAAMKIGGTSGTGWHSAGPPNGAFGAACTVKLANSIRPVAGAREMETQPGAISVCVVRGTVCAEDEFASRASL